MFWCCCQTEDEAQHQNKLLPIFMMYDLGKKHFVSPVSSCVLFSCMYFLGTFRLHHPVTCREVTWEAGRLRWLKWMHAPLRSYGSYRQLRCFETEIPGKHLHDRMRSAPGVSGKAS